MKMQIEILPEKKRDCIPQYKMKGIVNILVRLSEISFALKLGKISFYAKSVREVKHL